MDKIAFKLPDGAKLDDIQEIANSYNVTLKQSDERNFDGITFIEVAASIATLIQFFEFIKKKYGKRNAIKVEITINGNIEERTINYVISYLNNLKEKQNGSNNKQ